MKTSLMTLAERGYLPDVLVRLGIRQLCAQRLRDESQGGPEQQAARYLERIDSLRRSPIALHTEAANAQHYELPQPFFRLCLGKRLKYSCCLYARGDESLDQAEEAMLAFVRHARRIGRWPEYPGAWLRLGIVDTVDGGALSQCQYHRPYRTPHRKRQYIEAECLRRGLKNVRVITCDVTSCYCRKRSSIAAFPSRCSSTCATTKRCSAASPNG